MINPESALGRTVIPTGTGTYVARRSVAQVGRQHQMILVKTSFKHSHNTYAQRKDDFTWQTHTRKEASTPKSKNITEKVDRRDEYWNESDKPSSKVRILGGV
jgi:shikimate kinase